MPTGIGRWSDRTSARLRRWLSLGGSLLLLASLGCHRVWYRNSADKDVTHLVREKATDPRWAFPDLSVYMNPKSRYFDPTDPDHSPMPEDDPTANELMRKVDHKRGSKQWFKDGIRAEIENPDWRTYLDEYLEADDGRYKVRLKDAVTLAYLHSPECQSQAEEVYLSALDVAFERFRFDVQFFGGVDAFFTHLGKGADAIPLGTRGVALLPEPTGIDSNTVNVSSGLALAKLFPTGAELFVNFANSVVWQFAGTNSQQTISLLNFTLLQPLLRFGGRDVVLERLTRVERGLLVNLRALGRYRETLFTEIALGDPATGGPKRAGGFLGGAGLERGFSGIGIGGFGGAGETIGFGRLSGGLYGGGSNGATGAGFVGGGAGLAGGFLGLAQLHEELRHREANLATILREKARMEALFEANRIDRFQVEQFNQSVQTQLSQLLQARSQLGTATDAYLVSLGLPPDLPIAIDDPVIRRFDFFDPDLTQLDRQATALTLRVRQLAQPSPADLQAALAASVELHQAIAQRCALVRQEFDRAAAAVARRGPALADAAERQELDDGMRQEAAKLERAEKNLLQTDAAIKELAGRAGAPLAAGLRGLADELAEIVGDLALTQAKARLELIDVPPVELSPEEAFLIARANRLDWMNQRTALVDQWRLIGFNANRLESDLNLIFSGNIATPVGDDIFDFRRQYGQLSVGVQFDAPLTREAERNQYREALINFQAQRRAYIQYTDAVHQALRLHLRTLAEARANLEVQRKSFNIALRAFNLSRLKLREPPRDGKEPSPTTARDLLGALSDLLGAQNNFMSVWVQYEAARMRLYRDLGVMQFDSCGNWLDQPLEPFLASVEGATAPELESTPLPSPRPLVEPAVESN